MPSNYKYVTTPIEYKAALKELSAANEVAADTETYCLPEWEGKGGSALDPHTGRVSLLILKSRESSPYVFDILWLQHYQVDFTLLKDLLESVEYSLWHNAK